MNRCLITGEELNASTKIEHTILHSLGGRITSQRVTSSTFNQKCGCTIDPALSDIYKHIFSMLAPVTIAGANPGNVSYMSRDKDVSYYLNSGFMTLAKNIVIKGNDGKPSVVYAQNEEAIKSFSKKASLTASNVETVALPVDDNIAYRTCPILGTDIEIAVIKCIVLTIDEMTMRNNFPQIMRMEVLKDCLKMLKDYIINGDTHSQRILNEINQVYHGIQLKGPEKISQILKDNSIESHPFDHIIVVSGNAVTKCIDALWSIAGIEVHAVRLCSQWNDFDFTYIIQNSILKGTPDPQFFETKRKYDPLYTEHMFRSIQPASDGGTLNPFIPSVISKNRQRAYMEAIRYVEMNCNEQVFKEFLEPIKCMPTLCPQESILQHLAPLYKREKIIELWNKIFCNNSPSWGTKYTSDVMKDPSTWNEVLCTYRTILNQLTPIDENEKAIFSQENYSGQNR